MNLSICIISSFIAVIAASTNKAEKDLIADLLSRIKVVRTTNDSVVLQWTPTENEKANLMVIIRDCYSQKIVPPHSVRYDPNNQTFLTLKDLKAGQNYSSQLCQRPGSLTNTNFQCLDGISYFSTRPNPPENFTILSSSETDIVVNWKPPAIPCVYSHYQVYIEPFEGKRIYTDVEDQAIFSNLVPGKSYEITVATVSNYETSSPIVTTYRTRPNPPTNIIVKIQETPLKMFPLKIIVSWSNPQNYTEFDKFTVYLKQSPTIYDLIYHDSYSTLTVPRNTHTWTFENLIYCENYRVFIQTISEDFFSEPIYQDFKVEKEPLFCLAKHS